MKGASLTLAVIFLWAVGLLVFVDKVKALTPAPLPAPADAIVALTGASNARLETALKLLQDGKGGRLLITGVDKTVTKADLQQAIGGSDELYACCIDLGFQAEDTIGNAAETAGWVQVQGVKTLIVVTADFHMPRSLIELKARMPNVALVPHAVRTSAANPEDWWQDGFSAPRLALEYTKYLLVRAREWVLDVGGRFSGEEPIALPQSLSGASPAEPDPSPEIP
mgnify:CR=1 FL=1